MIGTLVTTTALALLTCAMAMPMSRKMLLGDIKQDWLESRTGWKESVILNVDLSARTGETVKCYRAGTETIERMKDLQKQWAEAVG